MSDAQKKTISSAGSARKPTNISRRAPRVPKAVPTSIAARLMKTRASANRPTSAMASAAGDSGRSVDSVGTIALASTMQPNTMYGAARNSCEALSASTESLWKSLCSTRYGCSSGGADLFCSHARHWLTQPVISGASNKAATMARSWETKPSALISSPPAAPRPA